MSAGTRRRAAVLWETCALTTLPITLLWEVREVVSELRVTYRQEQRRCGKAACVRCAEGAAHGPYWYAYWRDPAGNPKRAYCGKGPDRVALLGDGGQLHWVAPLDVQLFGGLVVEIGRRRVREHDWPRQSSRRLLALLLLHPRGLSRDALMDALWPDRPADAAANALKSALSGLRRVLEAAPRSGREISPSNGRLQHRASIVHLELTAFDAVDVHAFVDCGPVLHSTTGELERLVNLYTGDLLPEYVYEDWSSRHREHAQSVWRQAALELGHRYADRGEDQRAISHLKRLVPDDPTNEPSARLLMMLYARNQERGQATDTYRHLAWSLESTLGLEPELASQALYAHLQGSEAGEIAGAPLCVTANAGVICFPSEDRRAAADAWEKRALLLAQRGATQEALSSLESGRFAAGDGMSASTRGRLLLVESTIHNYIGDSRRAYDAAANAETLCDALGDLLLTAEARRLRARAALELNKLDEAFALARSSVALFATAGDDDGAMRSRRMVAFLLHRRGRFSDAKSMHLSNLEIAHGLANLEHSAYTLSGLGASLKALGELDAAERNLSEGLRYADVLDDGFLSLSIHYHLAGVWDDRAFLRRAAGEPYLQAVEEARQRFQLCIQQAQRTGSVGMELFSTADYAVFLLNQRAIGDGEVQVDAAESLVSDGTDNVLATGWLWLSRAHAQLAEGDWAGARSLAERALLFRDIQRGGLAETYRVMGAACDGSLDAPRAQAFWRAGLTAASSCGQRIEAKRITEVMAQRHP